MSQKEQEQKDYTNQIYQLASGAEGVPKMPFVLHPDDRLPVIDSFEAYGEVEQWCDKHGVDRADVGRVAVAAFNLQNSLTDQQLVQNNTSFSQSQY